jgi:hypothetical protein
MNIRNEGVRRGDQLHPLRNIEDRGVVTDPQYNIVAGAGPMVKVALDD